LGYIVARKRLALRKILEVRKILGNHAHLLRNRDILFLEESLRKILGKEA
jgi:hypothetical protein